MDSDAPMIVFTWWKFVGLLGVALFTGRWFVQLYYSRKAGRPVTPTAFWLLSMSGSVLLLTYFVFSPKRDMVGILSNFFPVFVSAYNLYLDLAHKRASTPPAATDNANADAPPTTPATTPTPPHLPLSREPQPASVSARLALATEQG